MWANRSGRSPKWATMSNLLRLLIKNEGPWANRSGRSPKWANEQIACFFERIAHSLIVSQNASDSFRKPMSEFPALPNSSLFFCLYSSSMVTSIQISLLLCCWPKATFLCVCQNVTFAVKDKRCDLFLQNKKTGLRSQSETPKSRIYIYKVYLC